MIYGDSDHFLPAGLLLFIYATFLDDLEQNETLWEIL